MGTDTFFSRLANRDPLAKDLGLPGANKYSQEQAVAGQYHTGPYTGVAPTLAAANAGYVPGGPGSNNVPIRPGSITNPAMPNSYVNAARGAVAQQQQPNYGWGT